MGHWELVRGAQIGANRCALTDVFRLSWLLALERALAGYEQSSQLWLPWAPSQPLSLPRPAGMFKVSSGYSQTAPTQFWHLPCSAQHPWPQARLQTSQTCWDNTLPVQRQGTAWAVPTSQSLILVAHNQQGFFCTRPFFCFLSLSLLLLWVKNQFLTGENKVQPPAEMQLSSMQCVPPGHPCLEENSLQTVHCDRAPSHGSWL